MRNWNEKQLRIYDCRGVETPNEYYEKDLIKTISGCIKKDYKVCTIPTNIDISKFPMRFVFWCVFFIQSPYV